MLRGVKLHPRMNNEISIGGRRFPRLRAPPGHGGASAVLSPLIRRGGAPSGATAPANTIRPFF